MEHPHVHVSTTAPEGGHGGVASGPRRKGHALRPLSGSLERVVEDLVGIAHGVDQADLHGVVRRERRVGHPGEDRGLVDATARGKVGQHAALKPREERLGGLSVGRACVGAEEGLAEALVRARGLEIRLDAEALEEAGAKDELCRQAHEAHIHQGRHRDPFGRGGHPQRRVACGGQPHRDPCSPLPQLGEHAAEVLRHGPAPREAPHAEDHAAHRRVVGHAAEALREREGLLGAVGGRHAHIEHARRPARAPVEPARSGAYRSEGQIASLVEDALAHHRAPWVSGG